MWLYWLILNCAWLIFFTIGERYAFVHNKLTLSQWVWDLGQAWEPFQFLSGLVVGGLAVHFWWHWLPAGAKSVG